METNNTNDIVFDLNHFISVIKKRLVLILIIYIGLFAATFIYSYSNKEKPIYQTIFTLNLPVTFIDIKGIIENFNILYGEDGIYRNSNKNNILSEDILNLKKIEVQKQVNEQERQLKKYQTIIISVYDTSAINPIIKELIIYINNNNFLVDKEKTEKEKKTNIIKIYKNQLNDLILYKQKIEKESHNLGSIPYYNIYKDIASFQEYITNLEYDLVEFRGCTIAVNPVIPEKAQVQSMTLTKRLILAIIFGLILSMFIVFFLDKLLLILGKSAN